MSNTSPESGADQVQLTVNCRDILRERYLDKVSSVQLLSVYRKALAHGWGLSQVQEEIDGLLRRKARELGDEPPC